MNRWAGPLFVVLLAAVAPLLVPRALLVSAWLPEIAVLAVVCAAFRGTPDRAAVFGIALGGVLSLWAPEPVCFRPFVLGTIGWSASHAAAVLHRDRPEIRIAVVAAAVLALRMAEHAAATIACAGGASRTAEEAGLAVGRAFVAAGVTGLAAPLWFGAVMRWGLLARIDRSFRDV